METSQSSEQKVSHWNNETELEQVIDRADGYARHWCSRYRLSLRRHIDDVRQTALMLAFRGDKGNPKYTNRLLWWGCQEACREIHDRFKAGEAAITMANRSYDPVNQFFVDLKRKGDHRKRHDFVEDCKDTAVLVLSRSGLEPWEIDMFVRNAVMGETAISLSKEQGVSRESIRNWVNKARAKIQEYIEKNNIVNPLTDYYKIERMMK